MLAAAFVALITSQMASQSKAGVVVPKIEVDLDEGQPAIANLSIDAPLEPFSLSLTNTAELRFATEPRCSHGILEHRSARTWAAPADCGRVTWSAAIPAIDQIKFDASAPTSIWEPKHQFWVLTNSLPWLRIDGRPKTEIKVSAKVGGRLLQRTTWLPLEGSAPLYVVAGLPIRRFRSRTATIEIFGDAPTGRRPDQLEQVLVDTIGSWERDLKPRDRQSGLNMRFVWFRGSGRDADPGIQASSGSDALLIEFIPDAADTDRYDKLEAGVLLTGAHEAFHSFASWMPGPKSAWFSESIATFFAYDAARRHLTGRPLAMAKELVMAPAAHSVLHAEERLERGDASDYGLFYNRGTRFWQAIDRVLAVKPNPSGKLAALLQQTRGFEGVAWNDPDSVATFFDRYSNGAAKRIVQCYLVDDDCPDAAR